ncbi:MAG: glycosyltransferase [Planctomycetes bacterium]|nr:glycosyltransferase [Planctomycetota bacterium]MCB9916910.1 glycosyltransferase [Planctomycetota bacterium]
MRILHVLSERGYSGGEEQLARLLEHLVVAGHDSVLVLNPGARFEATCKDLGLPVHRVRMRNDADVIAIARLRKMFKVLRPDLIHFACSRGHKLGAFAARLTKSAPPTVVTRRMDYPLGRGRFRRWLYGTAVDGVVAVSEGVRREVLAIGVPESHVRCIHDGVDFERFAGLQRSPLRQRTRQELGCGVQCPDETTVIGLTTASLHRRKGQDVLLDALGQLGQATDAFPGLRLVWLFAGDGPERATLEARATTLGLCRLEDEEPRVSVRFLGSVRPVDPLLAAADLFCLPSRKEGLGVALLEAMAAGIAVIGSAVGGMLEVIEHERSGLLVPVEDAHGIARSIASLLSADERRKIGDAARDRVCAEFTIERMCRATEAYYRELIARVQASRAECR